MIKISLHEFLKLNEKDISGKTVAFSTDTVFGLGVLCDENVMVGIDKIYEIKKRDHNKPIAVLIDNIDQVKDDIIISENILNLLDKWPGALTLIFKKKTNSFPFTIQTIGLRIPDSKIARSILSKFGPFATTSVNLSGEEALKTGSEIEKYFESSIDYLVLDEEIRSNISSTVVDLTDGIKVLRQGDIKI